MSSQLLQLDEVQHDRSQIKETQNRYAEVIKKRDIKQLEKEEEEEVLAIQRKRIQKDSEEKSGTGKKIFEG